MDLLKKEWRWGPRRRQSLNQSSTTTAGLIRNQGSATVIQRI